MALVYKDRVKETSTTTGTGTYTLSGAVSGFQSFSEVGNGNTCYYTAEAGASWEVGLGTWSTGGTLARTSVLASSNSNNAVSWSAGSKTVFLTAPATVFANLYADPLTTRGDLLVRGATSTGRLAVGASGYVLKSDGTDAAWAAEAMPRGHMHGLRVRYSSATAVIVDTGKCRDSTDAYDLTLSAEKTPAITTIAAAEGLDETTLTATATTHGTATFEPSASVWSETAFSSTVRSLTGTNLSGAGTTITGTGTKFLSELAVGDVIRSVSKGAARVTAIASDTSLTIAAAFPGGNPNGDAGTNSVYENVVIRIAAETPRRANTISHDGLSVVCASAWTSNTSGVAIKVGGETASCWYFPWVVYGGSGTTVILSAQRTRPYGVTGYTTAWRRIPCGVLNNASSDLSYFEDTFGGPVRYIAWRDDSAAHRLVSGGTATSFTKLETTVGAPATAKAMVLKALYYQVELSVAGSLVLEILSNRDSGSTAALVQVGIFCGTTPSTAGTNYATGSLVPLESAGGCYYKNNLTGGGSINSGGGYIDVTGFWEVA